MNVSLIFKFSRTLIKMATLQISSDNENTYEKLIFPLKK